MILIVVLWIVKEDVGIFRLCVLLKCTWCVLRLMDVRENTVKQLKILMYYADVQPLNLVKLVMKYLHVYILDMKI